MAANKLDSDGKIRFDSDGNLIPKAERKKPVVITYLDAKIESEINVGYIVVRNDDTMPKGARHNPHHGWTFPGQGADGYGRKISTDMIVQIKGEKRKRRVFCTCFSNAGSHWIVRDGKTLHLGTVFQSEIQSEFYKD
jgi:hypothetical protein